jgi:AcrR family transcriptional regulator
MKVRGPARTGRPPRELAGEVEERILDAAAAVFLERGFEGASVDEIAEVAHAGKPTIYARFPGKEALFAAVMMRLCRQNISAAEAEPAVGTLEERLAHAATTLLRNILAPNSVRLIRAAIAEAHRFPDLAGNVRRMARGRSAELVARILSESVQPDEMPLPPFAADALSETAKRFLDMIVLPMLLRALFGEDLAALNAEIATHAASTAAFFLAAWRAGGDGPPARSGADQAPSPSRGLP